MKGTAAGVGILFCCIALLYLGASPLGAAQPDPAVAGRWSFGPNLPFFPIHTHLLPTGGVMVWGYGSNFDNDTRVWDPITGTVSVLAKPGYDLFCSGHSFLADGRLLITGGHIQNNVGLANTSIYNPFTNSWTALPNMNAGRWYPTNTTLANGDVLVVSGDIDLTQGVNTLPQVFQTQSGNWRSLTSAQLGLDLYPPMHLAPNGKVFNSGPSTVSRYLDTSGTGSWSTVTNRSQYRDYGSSVLYDHGKILLMGGGDPPTNTAEVIDLNAASPSWRPVASMAFVRRQLNATILPDGKVLVTGGTSGAGFNNANNPVYAAEIWDPATESWTTMASAQIVRIYHSGALLLPDGRVLSTGGDGYPQAEIYEPPYLFKGVRPTITAASPAVSLGETFFLESSDAASITQVTLLRIGSVTHAFNSDQRISRLSFTPAAGGLNAVVPSSPNLVPPGYYMVFILNGNGVPSVGRMIQVTLQPPGANPAPTLSSLSPDNWTAGGAGFSLTVNGSNFIGGSVVHWNGSPRQTAFVSGSQLTAAISAADIAAAGTASITVVNPAPGGGISNSLAFTILPASTDTSVYQASADFSATQGFRNWYYLYGSGSQMTFDGSVWRGNEAFLLLWRDGGHPGSSAAADAIRRWKVPQAGSINVTGKAFDTNIDCGAGIAASIKKNSTVLWQQAIANGNTAGLSYNLATTAAAGDNIDFVINVGADNNNWCDSTSFDPTILFTPAAPPPADTTPPDTTITNAPATLTNSAAASFSFTSTEGGSNFMCQLVQSGGVDQSGFVPCTSPKSYSGLVTGGYTFRVRASDPAGNVDPTPASHTWTVDLTPPTVSIDTPTSSASYTATSTPLSLGGAAGDNNALAQVTWSNSRGGSGTATGTTNWSAGGIALQSGTNILTVTARDTAGNSASAILTVTYSAPDTTAPVRSNGSPLGTLVLGTVQTTISLTTDENATCRYSTTAGVAYGSMGTTFTTTGGTTHSSSVSGLTNGSSYNYFVRCQDGVGNANTNDFTISFSVALPVSTFTAFPTGTTVLTGTLSGGSASSLASDNNVYFAVNSTTSGTRTTAWYGSFSGVSGVLSNLRVNYKGNNSASCTQTVAIWRWSTGSWVQLDSRSVSTTEIAINNLTPSGTLANYVSTDGELRVRVQCTRSGNFTARGDLMSIVYNAPAGPPPVDSTAPVLSNGSPSGTLAAGTTQATLSLTTNENATCRYATTAGVAYGSMGSMFASTGGTTHSTSVSGLVNGGSYNYYARCQDSVGNANTSDFVIGFAVAQPAQTTTYQASADFSSTQGFRNWYYLYGSGSQMTFDGTLWRGNQTYLLLWRDGGHPGNTSAAEAIRRWKAPQAGSINVTGRAFDNDTGCGSGVSVSIKKNATVFWQQGIANGNTAGVSFNLTTTVAAGDNIDFAINMGADNDWCDATGFDPTILFTP